MTDWAAGADTWAKIFAVAAGGVAIILTPLSGFMQEWRNFRVQKNATTSGAPAPSPLAVAGPIMMHEDAAKMASAQERTAVATEGILKIVREHIEAEQADHRLEEKMREMLKRQGFDPDRAPGRG